MKLWENAVHVAMTHQRNKLQYVVTTVSQRLISIDRFEAAAELHEGIDNVEGAIKCYCLGGMFEKAKTLANGIPSMIQYIEQRHNQHLLDNKDGDELAARGHTSEVLSFVFYMYKQSKPPCYACNAYGYLLLRFCKKSFQVLRKSNIL